ncbi:MAG: hypothetical protein GY928_17975 [Colwellia sp.]|nr:hypothetical protein [Colwellia sp.]
MKEWKIRGNSNKNSGNNCNATNCPNNNYNFKTGNCEHNINWRGCDLYALHIKDRFNRDKRVLK